MSDFQSNISDHSEHITAVLNTDDQSITAKFVTSEQAFSTGISPTFYIGPKGDPGNGAYLFVKYAASATPSDADMSDTPNEYVGLCVGGSDTAPITASSYTWIKMNVAGSDEAGDGGSAEAGESAQQAAASATAAATSESNALSSAQQAAISATNAATSESNALSSAQAAAESSTAAQEAAALVNQAVAGQHNHDDRYYTEDEVIALLTGKANATHTHGTDSITGLMTALSGKANSSHTHSSNDISGLDTALGGKANSSHSHSTNDVLGLGTAISGKADMNHTHSTSGITGLDSALSGKANSSHTHSTSDITGLEQLVASGEVPQHTHATGDINGLDSALSGKANASAVVPLASGDSDGSFFRGSATPTGSTKLNYSGYFEATRVYGGYYSDYAEYFDVHGEINPGEIVALDPATGEMRRCNEDASEFVIGVVSNAFFICIGRKKDSANVSIGLVGKLPVKITGACSIGDKLVSAVNGRARSLRSGEIAPVGGIIGMALEATTGDKDSVLALIRGR